MPPARNGDKRWDIGPLFRTNMEGSASGLPRPMPPRKCGLVPSRKLSSQRLRMLLAHRKLLQSEAITIENDLRATLRNFGLKVWHGGDSQVRGAHLGAGREGH